MKSGATNLAALPCTPALRSGSSKLSVNPRKIGLGNSDLDLLGGLDYGRRCSRSSRDGWGKEFQERRPDVSMTTLETYFHNFYRVRPDFVFSVSRDVARRCQDSHPRAAGRHASALLSNLRRYRVACTER